MPIPPLTFRSVFVSDVHLGTAGCHAEEFLEFLGLFQCEQLYLVGDVVDVWVAFKSGKWKQIHTNVIRRILGMSKRGCKVYYTPGNHDAFLRKMNGADLGNIFVDDIFFHTTADGKKMYVVHGDLFDTTVSLKWLAWLGTWIYESVTVFNAWVNNRRSRKGRRPLSLHGAMKKRFKKAINSLTSYEDQLALQAALEDCDGVVCGHIHRPAIKTIGDGILYVNTGDWVENLTAVVEHFDGRLELVTWTQIKAMALAVPDLNIDLPHPLPEDIR